MMKVAIVALPALLFASAAAAQVDTSSSGNGSSNSEGTRGSESRADDNSEERRICRRVDTNTGSRVPFRRVCMTEREWRAQERRD